MPRRYSTREVARALERIGFRFVRQSGSHVQYTARWREMERHVTLVAGQRQIPGPTLSSVLKQASITRAELDALVAGEPVPE